MVFSCSGKRFTTHGKTKLTNEKRPRAKTLGKPNEARPAADRMDLADEGQLLVRVALSIPAVNKGSVRRR
jgi:hypothetical protein